MGPNGLHPQLRREMTDVIARLPGIIFEKTR